MANMIYKINQIYQLFIKFEKNKING